MAKKADAPEPPDYSQLANASVESAEIWAQVAREQMDWARETDQANRAILEQVLGVQLPQLEAAFEQAQADRQRYEEVFQPIEDNLVREFQSYDTQQRRDEEAARRMVDVRTQYEAQRRNALRELEDYGIDPSQTRFQALDFGMRAQEAANTALAANQGRRYVEETGRALRGEAINIGRGYPSQVAQSQGIVNQTAGGAVGNVANNTGASVNAFGTAAPYANLSMQGYGQAANIQNAGYNNALNAYNANAANRSGFWGGIGTLAGAALGGAGAAGGFSNLFGADGGEVPEDLATTPQPGDKYPVMLGDDEYVIPADVVRRKGTEFFDKLLDKYRDGGEYEGKRQAIG